MLGQLVSLVENLSARIQLNVPLKDHKDHKDPLVQDTQISQVVILEV